MMIESRFLLLWILGIIFKEGNCGMLFEEAVLQATCSLKCHDEPACLTDCTTTPKNFTRPREDIKINIYIVCRDNSSVVFRGRPEHYVIGSGQIGDDYHEEWTYNVIKNNGTELIIGGLSPGKVYSWRIYRVRPDGVFDPMYTGPITTMTDDEPPPRITRVRTGRLELDSRGWMNPGWQLRLTFAYGRHYYVLPVTCQQDNGPYNRTIETTRGTRVSVDFRLLPFGVNFTVSVMLPTLPCKLHAKHQETILAFSTPRCAYSLPHPRDCIPEPVTGLNATSTYKMVNIFDVHVTWDPPKEPPDDYDIDLYSSGVQIKTLTTHDVGVVFSNVKILKQFDVYIRASNKFGDGPKTSRHFTVPHTPIDGTAPAVVEGLKAIVEPKMGNTFDIHVSWDRPESIPDFYIVNITFNSSDTTDTISHNVSGSANETLFSDVEISEEFNVHVAAWSSAGEGPVTSRHFQKPQTPVRQIDILIPLCLAGGISLVTIMGIILYGYLRFRKRRLSQSERVDKFEISPKRLDITRVLGNGAFGVVKRGTLRDDQGNVTIVAVKMLKDDSNENDQRNFRAEINLMKMLDKHPNVISLLGCCTIGPYPLLVVEFCALGDLYSFLRKSAQVAETVSVDETTERTVNSRRSSTGEKILEKNCLDASTSRSSGDYIQVSSFIEDRDAACNTKIVTAMDMLNFGRQIATGMEYLSSKKVVHRDLATRNVLVCSDRTVKVSDFGLSRNIYLNNVYKKRGNDRMPLKWMAIEALTHQVYTTYSDVWSFGVLLWEIVTLGGNPYPGIPTIEILKQLQSGYRMERPENCSVSLYNLMLSCWRTKPRNRPTFTTLRQALDKLICLAASNEYLDLPDDLDGHEQVLANSNCDDVQISSFVANRAYDIDREAFRNNDMLTVTDLLNFGRQIATGMEFLSSNRVVHRDLAARNVLVCDDKTVKISDFGLSRDVYQENVYKKQGSGRLPVKWMAIEALTHQVCSTYSDVWSFGILLSEIVTLGSSPYPDIPANGVLKRLRSGYRMERPSNCSVPLYNLMLSCWQTKPRDRPTFTVLRQELDKLLCVAADSEYLDLNDSLKGTMPEDEDPQMPSSRYTYFPLQSGYINDREHCVAYEDQEGPTDETKK